MSTKTDKASRRAFLSKTSAVVGAALVVSAMPLAASKEILAAGKQASHRWGFLIDLERCIGCKACSVACKTEFSVPLGVFRSSVKEYVQGEYPNLSRDFVPWMCNHCENPICIRDCPVDEVEATFMWPDGSREKFIKKATYKRPDGVVLVDYDRCIGCGACVDLCPYGVRFLNPARKNTDGDIVADKCTLCAHRLNAGLVPSCINTCQANARLIGDLNDPESEISKQIRSKKTQVLLPAKNTEPTCRYVALNSTAYKYGKDTR